MQRRMRKLVRRLVHAWDSVQVELRGKYSVARLQALHAYTQRCSWARVAVVLLLTPLPCLLMILAADAIPLNPPYTGIYQQTTFWARSFVGTAIFTFTMTEQLHHNVPMIPLPGLYKAIIAVMVSIGTNAVGLLIAVLTVFPIPFTTIVFGPIWGVLITISLHFAWGRALAASATAQQNLKVYGTVLACQQTMLLLYPAFSYAFARVQGIEQTLLALVLPIIKIAIKNLMSRGLAHVPDTSPEVVTFNVDVFHTLYVSYAMQSATSNPSSAVALMGVDLVHSVVALHDVSSVLKRLDGARSRLASTSKAQPIGAMDWIAHALAVLDRNEDIQHRGSVVHGTTDERFEDPARGSLSLASVAPTAESIREATLAAGKSVVAPMQTSPQTAAKRYIVVTLQLLHMVEYFILIEYIEVIIAIVYAIYLFAMSNMPNRAYYPQLRKMDEGQLHQTVGSVLLYAVLEFASFLMLDYMLRKKVGYSPIKQLAFVLETQWKNVQSKLVLWVFFMVQASLDHFGADFSFKFPWITGREAP